MVKSVRRKYYLTQRALAQMLGCSEKTVLNWEKGIKRMSQEYRVKLKEIIIAMEGNSAKTQ